MKSELLQQVRVIDPVSNTDQVADVLVADGVIQALQEKISDYPTDTQVRDCRGLVLGPGLVDLYSHSGEPGFEERETWRSLLASAAAGGFTRLHILPDTMPAVDNLSVLTRLQQELEEAAVKVNFWAALTLGIKGQQMIELALASESHIVGFTDGRAIENLALLRRLLEYLKPINKSVALWACDSQLAGNGVMREGTQSIRFGLPGNPAIAETAALAAILEIVAAIGTPVHIMRVSTARSVQLIQTAKAQGLPITASTTWMHLLLDTQAVKSFNPHLRLEPPLGNTVDLQALRQGVRSGIIDAIAIDHTPYTYEEKTVAFAEAPPGAIGLELALPLLWQNLVETDEWSAVELWRSLSTHPTQCLQQSPSTISPHKSAEMILFDPQQMWTVESQTLKSLSANTPWLRQTLVGRVVQTWLSKSGEVVLNKSG
ncbi:dihydroorotase [Gloeocapsopsis dulcis]|uniref:Dihydroorotase n=1 Tax=Gloeocapsopsis dulcis AAB1 = 1H9 TaxID=1433147 RepID=A0A6N8FTL4_9CHRO|nr:dihydroorotase [Gloeocapsopsis dulcis]MUL36448.1 dihydroorotase [Gloeocapsopsis dulcis AAB1 = 1H9]WNN87738.1 dihydroorotase [Gloeocapsopsis dulcis]